MNTSIEQMQVTFVLLRAQVIYMTAADSADEWTYPETGLCNHVRKQRKPAQRNWDERVVGVIRQTKVGRSNTDNIISLVK